MDLMNDILTAIYFNFIPIAPPKDKSGKPLSNSILNQHAALVKLYKAIDPKIPL